MKVISHTIVHVPGPENVVADALVLFLSISTLVSPSRSDRVQDLGLTPFGQFLPRSTPPLLYPTPSTPSLLSPTPSPSSSKALVISGFDISLLPP